MKKIHFILLALAAALAFAACEYEFNADLSDKDLSPKLVLFADIVGAPDTCKVTISNTIGLVSDKYDKPVNLFVYYLRVECSDGTVTNVKNTPTSVTYHEGARVLAFRFAHPEINTSESYRVVASISFNGEEYKVESEWIKAIEPTPIDNLYYERYDENEVRIYADATAVPTGEDASYFKWTYLEDWEIRTVLTADIFFNVNTDSLERYPINEVGKYQYCWKSNRSTDIVIASTADNREPKIRRQCVAHIYRGNDRLSQVYRIEVRQSQISSEAYMYWRTLKENSEEIGGLFSAQPTEFAGNFKCVSDPDKSVLGYASVSKPSSRILYINRLKNLELADMYTYPRADSLRTNSYFEADGYIPNDHELYYNYGMYPVLGPDSPMGASLENNSQWVENRACADCRALGGIKKRPADWPTNNY